MRAVREGEEGQVLVQVGVGREVVRERKLDVGAEGVVESDADDAVDVGVDSSESGAGAVEVYGRRER